MTTKNDELAQIVDALNRIDGTLQLMIDLFLDARKQEEEEEEEGGYYYDT